MKKIKSPSEKNFGITFSLIFILIFVYIFFTYQKISFILLFISIFLFITSMLFPKILSIPNLIWFKFGIILSKVMTPFILGLIFFFVIGPISILRKLAISKKKNVNTNWKKDDNNEKTNFKKQY